MKHFPSFSLLVLLCVIPCVRAGVGDPQIRTDHPWYPGELACSTFDRLFATQAQLYEGVVGVRPKTDEEKVLAAWLWRNTHYFHAEEGAEDLWGKGFLKGGDPKTRDYWTGMFAHGFGLCGTTHAQWVAEIQALLGHNRGRDVGVAGHNSFEVFLTGGLYGTGKWVLLDHDLSTVIYDLDGKGLLSLNEIQKDWKRLTNRGFRPDRQPWLVCGLHPDDGGCYARYQVAEYLAGYSGAPPMVHLRRGESLKRFFQPGLEDGKTFVFWGRNYNTNNVPGPERSHTWVNQPEKMYKSKNGTGYKPGQARFANAVCTYKPDFSNGDYKEGIIREDDKQVVFEFYTPFIIGATPPNNKAWGIYDAGCRNGLVLSGKVACGVAISTDQGATWQDCGKLSGRLDLTDFAKGFRQYFLRFDAPASELREAALTITTVCQVNSSVLPRLKDNGTDVQYAASGQALLSAGPTLPQARAHQIGTGNFPKSGLEVATPRKEPVVMVHAAAQVFSSSPPRPEIKYQIEFSTDRGKTWQPLVKDWSISRRGHEPGDFWSQSYCWGSVDLASKGVDTVQVRYRNDGGKNYGRAEVHLVYQLPRTDATKVTYAWTDATGPHTASHVFAGDGRAAPAWHIPTGQATQTQWVEFEVEAKR